MIQLENTFIINFQNLMQNFILIEGIFIFIWDWTIHGMDIQILNNFWKK